MLESLPPIPFLLGLMLGFLGCCLAGHRVSGRPLFEHFVRFFVPIQPQRQFYPTASQLIAQVKATVPTTKIPVIVGGSSYLRGTGQNPDEVWSLELQRLLGDDYGVVNLAIDQGRYTDFAAVAFKALSSHYKHILYVANGSLVVGDPPDGSSVYRYVFWDAYYKGLLPPSVSETEQVRALRREHWSTNEGQELHLGRWLDQACHACDLWGYLGYHAFFTVCCPETMQNPFRARGLEREGVDTRLRDTQLNTRKDERYARQSEEAAMGMSQIGLHLDPTGKWVETHQHWEQLQRGAEVMFPAELRSRCLVLLVRPNPFFMQKMGEDDRQRLNRVYRLAQDTYERAGYQVVQLDDRQFTADDFIDGGHYMASGGRKIAKAVGEHIKDLERLSAFNTQLASQPQGALALSLTLPLHPAAEEEVLVANLDFKGSMIDALSLQYLAQDKLRLVYRFGSPERRLYSPTFSRPQGHGLSFELSTSGLFRQPSETSSEPTGEGRSPKAWLIVNKEGQAFWETPVEAEDLPQGKTHVSGLAGVKEAAGYPPFSGTVHRVDHGRPIPKIRPLNEIGGACLQFSLTHETRGKSLPLICTGREGAGDILFLKIDDAGNLRIGYDHWGYPSLYSDTVLVSENRPQSLVFQLPSLCKGRENPDLVVIVDDVEVWRQKVDFYPAQPEEVYFGKNPIRATTTDKEMKEARFMYVLNQAL